MRVKVGCDVVSKKRFEESAKKGGQIFLNKLFSSRELTRDPNSETLAGIFAAKEAVIKALELKAGDWQTMEILKTKAGRPEVTFARRDKTVLSHDISISHDGEYAYAVAVFLIS